MPEIAEYILDHEDYVFSSISVSVSGEVVFEPAAEGADIGTLESRLAPSSPSTTAAPSGPGSLRPLTRGVTNCSGRWAVLSPSGHDCHTPSS
ncbi:MAG: hypothetical protein ACRD1K_17015 [Acidimicrobiales bacterium]